MGVAVGDYDGDGYPDLCVTEYGRSILYHNNGNGTFSDVTEKAGIEVWGWASSALWFDYDNDGRPDLFVANGAVNIVESQRGQPFPFRMKNQLFHNLGSRFEETSAQGGAAFQRAEVSRGAAFGDIDNDGDVDVVFTNNNGPVRLLLNQTRHPSTGSGQAPSASNHWLEIRVEQPSGNRFAFGAWVGVERTGRPILWRRVRTDGSYLSASDSRLHFGLGDSTSVTAVIVQWPDGVRERFTNVTADRLVTLRRGTGSSM
jgi:hypothetical protein